MFKPLKIDRLKKVIDNKEESIVIEKDRYDPDTGELSRTEEHMIDPVKLGEREQILKKETNKINTVRERISKSDFDKVEDERNHT